MAMFISEPWSREVGLGGSWSGGQVAHGLRNQVRWLMVWVKSGQVAHGLGSGLGGSWSEGLSQVVHRPGCWVVHGSGDQTKWLMDWGWVSWFSVWGIRWHIAYRVKTGGLRSLRVSQVALGPRLTNNPLPADRQTAVKTLPSLGKNYKKLIAHREFLGPTIGGWLYDNVGFAWCMTGCGGFNLVMVSIDWFSQTFKTLID